MLREGLSPSVCGAYRHQREVQRKADPVDPGAAWRARRLAFGCNPFKDCTVPWVDEDKTVVAEMTLDPYDE